MQLLTVISAAALLSSSVLAVPQKHRVSADSVLAKRWWRGGSGGHRWGQWGSPSSSIATTSQNDPYRTSTTNSEMHNKYNHQMTDYSSSTTTISSSCPSVSVVTQTVTTNVTITAYVSPSSTSSQSGTGATSPTSTTGTISPTSLTSNSSTSTTGNNSPASTTATSSTSTSGSTSPSSATGATSTTSSTDTSVNTSTNTDSGTTTTSTTSPASPSATTTTTATTTTSGTSTPTNTPTPTGDLCNVHGIPVGDYYLGEIVTKNQTSEVTLYSCHGFCASIYGYNMGCKSFSFYYVNTGAPRCDLYSGTVSQSIRRINPSAPRTWYDLGCEVDPDASVD